MTIDAINFNRSPRFAIDFPVAVIVLREMAVGALHTFFKMNIREVDSFLKALRIIEGDLFAVLIEPIPFTVVFVRQRGRPSRGRGNRRIG